MERTVKNLFDFQRFKQNVRLDSIIRNTENRYASALSDDDLEWVSAAGESDTRLSQDEDRTCLPADQLPTQLVLNDERQKP